jgi:hypothetical protein
MEVLFSQCRYLWVLFEWVGSSNWGWRTVGARKNQIWASRVDRADLGAPFETQGKAVLRPSIGKGSGGALGDRPSIRQMWRGKTAPSER